MSLGQKVSNVFQQFFVDNSYYIVVLVTLALCVVDFYNRYMRINKNTDNIDLIERYCWLEYYRNRAKRQ